MEAAKYAPENSQLKRKFQKSIEKKSGNKNHWSACCWFWPDASSRSRKDLP